MAGLFAPGGLMGPLQPGMPGAANPLALMLAGAAQGNTLGGLQSIGRLQQAGARTAQTGEYQRATLAAQQEETQRAIAARANQISAMRALAPVYGKRKVAAGQIDKTLAPGVIAERERDEAATFMNAYMVDPEIARGMASDVFGAGKAEPLKPVQMPDGSVIYMPASEASYKEVPKKAPLVQIGGDFKTPQGGIPTFDESGQVTGVRFVPGTKEFENRKQSLTKVSQFINRLRALGKQVRRPGLSMPGEGGPAFFGEPATKMRTEIEALRLLAKSPEFEQLGVLSGPDLEILSKLIPDATDKLSWNNLMAEFGITGALAGQYETYADMLQERMEALPGYEQFSNELPKSSESASEAGAQALPKDPQTGLPMVNQDDDALIDELPEGTVFRGTDGIVWRKVGNRLIEQ